MPLSESFSRSITNLSPERRVLLELQLQKQDDHSSAADGPFIPRRDNNQPAPLSFAQQRLWFLDQMEAGSAYNITFACELAGMLDVVALEQSLNEIIRRHQSLRTTFSIIDQNPMQVIRQNQVLSLPVIDLRSLPNAAQQAQVQRYIAQERDWVFDLTNGPLLKISLLQLEPKKFVLIVVIHHIVFDGWSVELLFGELAEIYNAFVVGKPSPLAEPDLQYADFAAWQQNQLNQGLLQPQLDYWKAALDNAPSLLNLATDRPRPARQNFRGAQHSLVLSPTLSRQLKQFGQRHKATLFMTLLTAFKALLYRYTDQDDIVVGTPIANRSLPDLEGLIGVFINNLALRTKIIGDPSFIQLLGQVRETSLQAFEHQDLPFEELVKVLQPERDLSYNPLFQVMFVLENTPQPALNLTGIELNFLPVESSTEKFDLTLAVVEDRKTLQVKFTYRTDLFEPATIERMAAHFQQLLEGIIANPNVSISQLPLLTHQEQHQLLVEWNQTEADFSADVCIHQLFEAQAEKTPNAIAARFGDQQLTYREINRRANQLARHLQTRGVGPEIPVALYFERSPEMVVGLLAILKAGGAFLPLDPESPPERLAFMLEDTATPLILTQQRLKDKLPAGSTTICLDTDWNIIAQEPSGNLPGLTTPHNLAYIIYTSGSTGKPKGVAIPHRGLVNYLMWCQQAYQPELGVGAPIHSSIAFDLTFTGLFAPLLSGNTVYLLPDDSKIEALSEALQHGMDFSLVKLTPTHLRLLSRQLSADDVAGGTRSFVIGGENLLAQEVAFWQNLSPEITLINEYGPTEAVIGCCVYRMSGAENLPSGSVPIGRPIVNTQLYALDRQLQPVPIGVPGELYIGGDGLARGYFNRPDLTAEKFIPNPFGDEPGSRLYKTGDLVRYLSDGKLEFLGRIDNQVKIRGFRIELGEIEVVLGQHPAVRETVVVVHEDKTGDRRLAAYIVLNQEQAPTAGELRKFLKQKLPEYMVPAAFVTLDTLPLTPNGKVDRRALPEPDQSRLDLENNFVTPRTEAEKIMAEIWAEILGAKQVGIHDNFFELGGHSLLAMQVIARISDALQVELPLRSIFEAPTIADLALILVQSNRIATLSPEKQEILQQRLKNRRENVAQTQINPLKRDTNTFPVSFAQQRLWFLNQLEPESSVYNSLFALRLIGSLKITGLEQSIEEIVRRHEALRTTFSVVDGEPFQVIAPNVTLKLPIVDLRHLSNGERDVEVNRLIRENSRKPFDLSKGPLIRACLLRLGEEEHILLLTMHHIISDGWSMDILLRELSILYEAFLAGKSSPLSELPIQYADFAVWQRQWLREGALKKQLDYWKQQLDGAPPALELPTDRPRPAIQSHRGAIQTVILSQTLSQALKSLSQQEEATLFMTLLAAFKALLYRYTGQDDIVVGTPIANRNRTEIEGLIGFFVNTLVLRTELSGHPTFQELLGRVREVALGAYAHQDLPFEKLVEELQPERDPSRTPLFQVFFNMFNPANGSLELSDVAVEPLTPTEPDSKFDLTLYVREKQEGIQFRLVYNADLFDQARIVEMLEQFKNLLSQVVENPDKPIERFSLVTASAKRYLPDPTEILPSEWAGAIHTKISWQSHRISPDFLAVIDEYHALSYKQVDILSNQLANYLVAGGIQPQEIVAVYGHRSAALVWALLGILKAGAAFVILDPAYPAERLVDYCRIAKPKGWIQLEAAGTVPDQVKDFVAEFSLCSLELPQNITDDHQNPLADYSSQEPNIQVGPDDVAYVTFTSGTSGKPNAVVGTHGPLSHFINWHADKFGLQASDRFSLLSGLAHDPVLRDIFTPLCIGATLYIPDLNNLSPGELADWMAHNKITVAHLTPAMTEVLIPNSSSIEGRNTTLRYLFFGGDVLTRRHLVKVKQYAPVAKVVNFYGATETPQAMGHFIVSDEADVTSNQTIPVGQGIEGVQLLVLNSSRCLAGVGEPGEIYVRTPYLAQGYLDDEDLTGERFIINPFTQIETDRLYRTGDCGRYLPNGNVEFLGRIDRQVKLRGFRIEPGEIEAALNQHTAVRQTIVLADEDGAGDKQLVAYVVPNQEQTPTTGELRSFLKQKLPDYLIPSAFVMLDALPLTPNGKVDRQALPAPNQIRPEVESSFVEPQDPLERRLTRIWQEILDVHPIGVKDNFFELGGHSLLGVRLFAQLEEVFGEKLPLATLFQSPTVEQLANVIRQTKRSMPSRSSLVAVQTGGSKRPFFCVPGNLGNVFVDLGDLARYLGPDQPFYGLQDGIQNPIKIEALAAHYLEEIQAIQPEGPYLLGGVCSGAMVAFQMAQQLRAQGQKVALLALIEPSHPRPSNLSAYTKLTRSIIRQTFRQIDRHAQNFSQLSLQERKQYMQLKLKLVANLWALLRYKPQLYPDSIHLFLTRESFTYLDDPQRDWRKFVAGPVEIHQIPGNHNTITGADNTKIEEVHMEELSKQLRAYIDEALSENS